MRAAFGLRTLGGISWLCLVVGAGLGGCATPAAVEVQEEIVEVRSRSIDDERALMRKAMHAHLEFERRDAAHLIEHALHARELAVAGREDEEALHVRRTAPRSEQLRELLLHAAEVFADARKPEIAERIGALANDLWSDPLAGTEEPRRERDGREAVERKRAEDEKRHAAHEKERAAAERQIEVIGWAEKAWREHGRNDVGGKLEHAALAKRMALAGRRDDEAVRVRETAPEAGAMTEMLAGAADLWMSFGHDGKAKACDELAAVYRKQWERSRAGKQGEHRDEGAHLRKLGEALERFMERVEKLEMRMEKVIERLERVESRDR